MNRVKITALLLCLVMLLCACGKGNTVMTIGGEDVSYDTYRYFYLNYKRDFPDISEEALHEKVVETISLDIALNMLAETQDVGLNKEEKESVDSYVKDAISQYGGKAAYKKALEEAYLTEKLFRYLYSQQLLESKLREYYYMEMNNLIVSDDATLDADIKENFMAAKQVLIRFDNGYTKESNKAHADKILEKALNGEDFDSLVKEYSEDTTAVNDYTYHFTYGQMVEGFENAVADTPIGEVCEYVAESEIGYHIIMRVPLDKEYIDTHYEELRDAFKARRFNEMRQTLTKSFTVEKAEGFDEIDFNE
ncbi:MAG: peptidylprolyl isomerase [Clostridia bacterium]|nr:peptidylprolyl isomerase [Clostridia bacterium]